MYGGLNFIKVGFVLEICQNKATEPKRCILPSSNKDVLSLLGA